MEKIVLMILVLCVVVRAYRHPKFPHYPNEFRDNNLKKEKCSREKEDLRNEYIERSKCGKPKEVFVHLNSASTSELVIPKAVWVARCAGTCDYDGHECVATVKRTLHIPVRVSNISTGKESCSTYEVEEHVSCGCCSKRECEAPQIFNPRKCTCQCPNVAERRSCLRKRSQNMKWNRFKCACEVMRRKT